jgi:hypothetical protein
MSNRANSRRFAGDIISTSTNAVASTSSTAICSAGFSGGGFERIATTQFMP